MPFPIFWRIIYGPHRGSFAVLDHLRSNLGSFPVWESFAVLYPFALCQKRARNLAEQGESKQWQLDLQTSCQNFPVLEHSICLEVQWIPRSREQVVYVVLLTLMTGIFTPEFFPVQKGYGVHTQLTVLLTFIKRNYQDSFPVFGTRRHQGWTFLLKIQSLRTVLNSFLGSVNFKGNVVALMCQSNRSFNTPRASEFLENFCSNSSLPRPKSCSNAPTRTCLRGRSAG